MIRFPAIPLAHLVPVLLLATPAEARLAHLPTGPAVATAATSAVPALALTGNVVPEEPEITVRIPLDRHGREDIRGGQHVPVMTDDGVLFRVRARGANHVSLVAEFTDWRPRGMKRNRGGVWEITVPLPAGTVAYLFLVDGIWILDPDNPVTTEIDPDLAGGETAASLLTVRHGQVVMPVGPGSREASFGLRFGYDRVDAVSVYGRLRYENRPRLHPDISLLGGYAFGRDRGLYEVGLTQPVFGPRVIDLGGTIYRRTDTRDEHRIGTTENSLAAFFGRQDWRDWFESEGASLFASLYAGPVGKFTGEWRREEQRTLEKVTDWGLFYPNRTMRDNPAIDEGELGSFGILWERDTRNDADNPTRGGWMAAGWEWFGDDFGGDYRFQRGVVDLRRYVTVSPGYWFDIRLMGGTIRDAANNVGGEQQRGFEAIPFQERFYVGGIGTMRATVFKSLEGDRMFLGNAEIRVEVVRQVQLAFFVDAGDAWVDGGSDPDLKVDGGIGLQDSDSNVRLNLATKLDGRGGDVIFSGRIQRMF